MPNGERRKNDEARSPKPAAFSIGRGAKVRTQPNRERQRFVIPTSGFVRHSSFGFRSSGSRRKGGASWQRHYGGANVPVRKVLPSFPKKCEELGNERVVSKRKLVEIVAARSGLASTCYVMPNQPLIVHRAATARCGCTFAKPAAGEASVRDNLRHRKQELTAGHDVMQNHVTEVMARIAPTPRRSHSTEPAADCAWQASATTPATT